MRTNRLASSEFWAVLRRKGTLALCLALYTLGLSFPAKAQDHKATIITFDAPGAQVSQFSGTLANLITPAGDIAGFYLDANQVSHGFLRSSKGTFTTIDAPGAGSVTGSFQGTFPKSITPAGAIAGNYDDSGYVFHGFLRSKDGTFTSFDAPGAGTGMFQGTVPLNINPVGAIAGQYQDASSVWHGFLRAPDGVITTFDAPGAGTGPGQGTFTSGTEGLNPAGAISGSYADDANVFHGFVRDPDGTFIVFDVPGAGTASGQGTGVGGINPAGVTQGNYIDAAGVSHGFVRAADGTFSTFDVVGAGTASGQGTFGVNMNMSGAVDGFYVDANGADHALVRSKHGQITAFDAPGAGTQPFEGTTAGAINPAGAIAGTYSDENFIFHGYLRTP